MIKQINWDKKVVEDYRERIIIDPDSPILAFKASRDRYTLPSRYAGLSHLGSWQSEDALTWNVFRSLQKAGSLDIITNKLGIGQPRGLLLWTLAPETDDAKLQYVTGALIRRFDGIFRGQMTEPDAIILGTKAVAVIECKLSEPDEAPGHLWEGKLGSVKKRHPVYQKELPHLIKDGISDEEIVPVYQLVRMAFYANKLGAGFGIKPVVVSLANRRNWSREIHKLDKAASDLWGMFCKMLGTDSPRCEAIFWQDLGELIQGKPLDALSVYLSTHRCL